MDLEATIPKVPLPNMDPYIFPYGLDNSHCLQLGLVRPPDYQDVYTNRQGDNLIYLLGVMQLVEVPANLVAKQAIRVVLVPTKLVPEGEAVVVKV